MDNAIIMASGKGLRLRPLTEKTPKPLIEVGGKPMIETVIDGLLKRGSINEIVVVAGYLNEQFGYLKEKYHRVRIILNPYYEDINNISSVYVARDELKKGDCFICEADLCVCDEEIFCTELKESAYFGKYVEGHTDDWVFSQDASGRITRVGTGGDDCYAMTGICYLKKEEAERVAYHIEQEWSKEGYEKLFWDDVVNMHIEDIELTVHPVTETSIREIDTLEELEEVNSLLQVKDREK